MSIKSRQSQILVGDTKQHYSVDAGTVALRDVTEDSFTRWREKSGLSPKTLNDCLSNMGAFLNWMKRRRLIVANPLEHVQKVSNDSPGNFRRALSVDEINRLLSVAPAHRATIYQTILYTGLRRQEINGLRWGDFDFTVTPTRLKVPSSIFEEPKGVGAFSVTRADGNAESVSAGRSQSPRLVVSRPGAARPHLQTRSRGGGHSVRGRARPARRFARAANDFRHVAVSERCFSAGRDGADAAQQSEAHKVYTDASQLPLIAEAARLPSFSLPCAGVKRSTLGSGSTLAAVVSGSEQLSAVVSGHSDTSSQTPEVVAFRREKTAEVASSGFLKRERAKRLELNAGQSETGAPVVVVKSANTTDTQLSTHATELAEIAALWPALSGEVRSAVLNLVRVSQRHAT